MYSSRTSRMLCLATSGMTLQFDSDNKVHVTVYDPPHKETSAVGEYALKKDRVTIQIPNAREPFVLTRKGDALEMTIPGKKEAVKFAKK